MKEKIKSKYSDIILLCLCVTAVLVIIWTFTGQWPWKGQPYNSYILQAQSWLKGRLDLGQNYSHLEIAVFNGKYYISFPPFPSYVMLPFVLIGWNTCDGMIAFITSLAGAVYAFKILKHFEIDSKRAIFFSLFLTVASNWLLTAQIAWVWFIAQNMAFTLSLMAIYYALKNKAGLSLAFWACSVGCRPFQALYILVLLYLLYNAHKAHSPEDKITDMLKKRYLALIPMLAIAISYMILNFARFGSITQFGHDYLAEHVQSELGQFSPLYLKQNLPLLFKLPSIQPDGKVDYPMFNGMCIFIISPIFVSYVVYTIRSFVKKENSDRILILISLITAVIELIIIAMHNTMGGSHFGNRYPNDVLPIIFLSIASVLSKDSECERFNYPLFFIGLALNLIGTTTYFLQ